MSFNGDLEHFPLVDVIQMLHMTSKTGVLYLKSPKGESQLVFHEGFFVSANHLNNSVRIGKVLVDMDAITTEQLNLALLEQQEAGKKRKPLIATLIEQGTIDKETAFNGLEKLIEMTIVEVLTWASGTFSLDVATASVCDEYRYFPEKLQQDILLNAQGVLMESLRIYDEKMRDGTLSKIFFAEEASGDAASSAPVSDSQEITADLLGLDTLDTITRKIPDVFIGLKDHDPVDEHRQAVTKALPETTVDQQERLVSYLTKLSASPTADSTPPVTAIILLTQDQLLSHAITTVCKHENLFVFASDEELGLDIVIEQSLSRDLHPVLIIDIPHDSNGVQSLGLMRQKTSAYPQVSILFAACCEAWRAISMEALGAGTRAIIPRPCKRCHEDSYVTQMLTFLSGMGFYLKSILPVPQAEVGHQFSTAFNQLKALSEPPEIALVMLQFAALQFERALTFVVAKSEVIAEKSIGVTADKSEGASPPLMFRIPLEKQSVLLEVVEKGRLYYGQRNDNVLTNILYKEIGAPRSPKVMMVPLISRGKVIAVTYADFGAKPVSPPQTNLLETLAQHAGSILDNALYRKSIENGPDSL
ncbi:MAG: DUF4388 domain-containing protein [Desulfuromonadaceae bacterium]|nr:DUF4388 domain-containing protein [Desulfuromonadaceae bacterium]MDD2848377.1 DUF4388 domain-containing protein [Desulfuromonadaceae bacterium]MDD4129227.1 DUF4388 domain-containing protein [Desulfuromonadaceae bacterium]